MGVELPQLLRVTAHELRGPLGVIQGYVRLMIRQRNDTDADLPMLKAILDASGRLSALARQASDLGTWQSRPATAPVAVGIGEVLSPLEARGDVVLDLTGKQRGATVVTPDPVMLGLALGELASWVARSTTASKVRMSQRADAAPMTLLIRPDVDAPVDWTQETQHAMTFDHGGFGLALVLAAFVLDSHGASVTVGALSGGLTVSLVHVGGAD